MMNYIIGWESDRKEVPILCEKCDCQFPRFSPYNVFCYIFPCYGKLMGKLMHFPYDEAYHTMETGWEKSTPIRWVFLHFPVLWEIDGKSHAFPIWRDSLILSCDLGWVSWGYLPNTDISCRPQFRCFLPSFLCCYVFSKWNIYFFILVFSDPILFCRFLFLYTTYSILLCFEHTLCVYIFRCSELLYILYVTRESLELVTSTFNIGNQDGMKTYQ